MVGMIVNGPDSCVLRFEIKSCFLERYLQLINMASTVATLSHGCNLETRCLSGSNNSRPIL